MQTAVVRYRSCRARQIADSTTLTTEQWNDLERFKELAFFCRLKIKPGRKDGTAVETADIQENRH